MLQNLRVAQLKVGELGVCLQKVAAHTHFGICICILYSYLCFVSVSVCFCVIYALEMRKVFHVHIYNLVLCEFFFFPLYHLCLWRSLSLCFLRLLAVAAYSHITHTPSLTAQKHAISQMGPTNVATAKNC